MKFSAFLLCSLIFTNSFSQIAFSEGDAKNVIDTFFEGFHKGDTLLMKSVIAENIVMQTAYTDKNGSHKVKSDNADGLLIAIANRAEDQKWDERLLDYTIKIDGNLAHVWTPYEFWLNENFSHCGANSFTLAMFNDGWKIIHLIDSRRKEDCK